MVDKPQWLYSQNEIFWQGKLKYPVNWDEITVNLQVRYNAEPFNPLFRYSCGFILVAAILGMVMSAFIIIQVMANEFVSSGFTFYMIVFSGFVIAEVLGIRFMFTFLSPLIFNNGSPKIKEAQQSLINTGTIIAARELSLREHEQFRYIIEYVFLNRDGVEISGEYYCHSVSSILRKSATVWYVSDKLHTLL